MYADPTFGPTVRVTPGGQRFVLPELTTDLWLKMLQLEQD